MPRIHLVQSLVYALAVIHCIVLVKLGFDSVSHFLEAQDNSSLLVRATEVKLQLWIAQELQLTRRLNQKWLPTSAHGSPIHLVLTSTASYNTGLLALVNSTLTTASGTSLPRLHFHIISSNQVEAHEVAELLRSRFGARVEGKLTAYGLAEVGDERLEGVKVWGGYRSEQLSKVSLPKGSGRALRELTARRWLARRQQPIVFARYLVQDILPDHLERVIYLDQDVLVQKDLAPLWDIDLQGHPLAAAREWGFLGPAYSYSRVGELIALVITGLCRPTALVSLWHSPHKAPPS